SGFLGLSTDVRKGYRNIRVKFKVKSDEKNIERIKRLAEFSPVYDVVSSGTNVDFQIEWK
ncbi:MAG: OsmC family protein, partial [Planctomycetota bacterium]